MRILYIDIDCLRPDHLGCYGYHRPTSPNIDAIAAQGVRFENVYASDVPCLPSRTAMFSGRFGIHTGAVNHGGARAELYSEGEDRGFASRLNRTSWMRCLRDRGLHTATVSSFAERHSAFHFCANFNEVINPGKRGLESGELVGDLAVDWLARNAQKPDWFLHVHLWDPHTPYRAPASLGEPFAHLPTPAWLTEDVRQTHFASCGPHSAQDTIGFADAPPPGIAWNYPRQPTTINNAQALRAMFDGYDTGVLHADVQVGRLLQQLRQAGVQDDVVLVVSADHGENLGELNVYGDHQTADQFTTRVPFVLRWPHITKDFAGQARTALHYQIDLAATLVELAGGQVPNNWDGQSFAAQLQAGQDEGRDALVLSQAAWACQRGVRFAHEGKDYLFIRSYHDAYHLYPDNMLFDLSADPHEQHNLAEANPQLVQAALQRLDRWVADALARPPEPIGAEHGDPLPLVMKEGGPFHVRRELPTYLQRLRTTGREALAEALEAKHPQSKRPQSA